MQIIFYLICSFLYEQQILFPSTFYLIKNYHYALLIFNLLPIWPLDGAKLLNLNLLKIFPYKKTHLLTLYISYIVLVLVFLFLKFIFFNISLYLLLVLLLFKVIEENKNHDLLFNKFLLERYIYRFNFKKIRMIDHYNLEKMMYDKKHFFKLKNHFISEKEALKRRFK